MKSVFYWIGCLVVLLVICGCSPAKQTASNSSTEKNGHSHADGSHNHDHDHGHSHDHAPHGGTLFDWGGGSYHVEFTVDHDRKEAVIYILGDDAKSPVAIKADKIQLVIDEPFTELDLIAQPLDSEGNGMSSRFVGQHETLGIVREFSGTVSGVVEGTPYSGDFKELPHGHDH